ncbi:MAG: hypothetical protein KatS3mg113_0757 [Planctomycetaceae bacterium]|nr:MAG: hypothetical protein KatS3mg113_0757 [Planctomycetaceae bacterium]
MMGWAPTSLKHNLLVSWVAHAAALVVGFFLMPYIIKVLGDHAYGTWIMINTLASYSGLLYFGFGETLNRYLARYHALNDIANMNRLMTTIMGFYCLMAGCLLFLALCLALYLPYVMDLEHIAPQELSLTIMVIALTLAVSMIGSVYGGVLMGLRRFDLERLVGFLSDFLRIGLVVTCLKPDLGLIRLALIFLVITLFENAGFFYLAHKKLPSLKISTDSWDPAMLRALFSYSSMSFINSLAYQLINASDALVIGFFLGPQAVVPYYVALRLGSFIKQPIERIAVICLPAAGALSADPHSRSLKWLLIRSMGLTWLLSIGAFVGSCYFGNDVIKLWMGVHYIQSYPLLIILMLTQCVTLAGGIMRAILFGQGHTHRTALFFLGEAILKLMFMTVGCRLFGVIGAAWGGCIAALIAELFGLIPYGLNQMNITFTEFISAVLQPLLLPMFVLWIYCVTVKRFLPHVDNWPGLLAISLAGGALVMTTHWAWQQLIEGNKERSWMLRRYTTTS